MAEAHRRAPGVGALVTGASSGIGFEIAACLAERGHNVMIVSEDETRLRAAAEALQTRFPDQHIIPIRADLSHQDGPQALYDAVVQSGQDIGILVNNAGVGVWGPFADHTNLKKELAMIQLNATSAVQLTKKFLPRMLEQKSGRLLFTASVASLTPIPLATVYGATKAFLYSFAEGLREELKGTGVTVTALLPGATATNWFDRAGAGATKTAQGSLADPREVAEAGVEAMMRGDDHVVTPFKDRVQAVLSKFMSPPAQAQQSRLD